MKVLLTLAFTGLLILVPSTFAADSFSGTSSFENVPS